MLNFWRTSLKGLTALCCRFNIFCNAFTHLYKNNQDILIVLQPLWTVEPKDISDESHLNFFRYLSGSDQENYLYKLFYKTDAPLNLRRCPFKFFFFSNNSVS